MDGARGTDTSLLGRADQNLMTRIHTLLTYLLYTHIANTHRAGFDPLLFLFLFLFFSSRRKWIFSGELIDFADRKCGVSVLSRSTASSNHRHGCHDGFASSGQNRCFNLPIFSRPARHFERTGGLVSDFLSYAASMI